MLKRIDGLSWQEADPLLMQLLVSDLEAKVSECQTRLEEELRSLKEEYPRLASRPHPLELRPLEEIEQARIENAAKEVSGYRAEIDRVSKCLVETRNRPWFVCPSYVRTDNVKEVVRIIEEYHQARLSVQEHAEIMSGANRCPVLIDKVSPASIAATRLWYCLGHFYEADGDLSGEDVFALVTEGANKRRIRLEKARAAAAMVAAIDDGRHRQPIPREVRLFVWQRDGGRCVECRSQNKLHFDHIIPFVLGGSSTERNLQLLCETCNLRKGASLG